MSLIWIVHCKYFKNASLMLICHYLSINVFPLNIFILSYWGYTNDHTDQEFALSFEFSLNLSLNSVTKNICHYSNMAITRTCYTVTLVLETSMLPQCHRIFKFSPTHASVIYLIPWIQWKFSSLGKTPLNLTSFGFYVAVKFIPTKSPPIPRNVQYGSTHCQW